MRRAVVTLGHLLSNVLHVDRTLILVEPARPPRAIAERIPCSWVTSMNVDYQVNPAVTNAELDQLYLVSWPSHREGYDFRPELDHALAYVCAYVGEELVGFVRLAWDGSVHAFLLEPTVRPEVRRRGIGRSLVARAVAIARERGLEWVHVDFEPHLRPFYDACGFRATDAGLIRLR